MRSDLQLDHRTTAEASGVPGLVTDLVGVGLLVKKESTA